MLKNFPNSTLGGFKYMIKSSQKAYNGDSKYRGPCWKDGVLPPLELKAFRLSSRYLLAHYSTEGELFSPVALLSQEMAKVVQVWKGDYNLEKALDPTPTSLDALNLDYDVKPINFGALGIAENCADCAVNAFALQGYLEAKAATNNWAISLARYKELSAQQPFYYSIAGHGLGGMHG